ncbi:MAG TPA: hypothetical protein VGR35_07065 [Tepidisphaeraceae bacterium]|nr:hypothetical protein [Tepidisphaeraceae bacterium]
MSTRSHPARVTALLMLLVLTSGGCAFTSKVTNIGQRYEEVARPPEEVIYGTDGSVAVRVQTRLRGGGSAQWRTRYIVLDADTLAKRAARAPLGTVHPTWVTLLREGRFVPRRVTAGDARREDLPPALRGGRREPWAARATTRPGTPWPFVPAHVNGRDLAIVVGDGSGRMHRSPLALATTVVLILPAMAADVVTFPVQLWAYGTYFDRPAPGWVDWMFNTGGGA